MTEVQSGDVVRLRSGGPKMTVEKVENGAAACCFFAKKSLVRETFQVAAVEVVEKAEDDAGDGV
jgi:uncharacterized protein YodC (DUF2158 family)